MSFVSITKSIGTSQKGIEKSKKNIEDSNSDLFSSSSLQNILYNRYKINEESITISITAEDKNSSEISIENYFEETTLDERELRKCIKIKKYRSRSMDYQ